MSNQKTTQLQTLVASQVSAGDWIPIVDVSAPTSPTGETKKISVVEFATYTVSGGFVEFITPYQGLQYANGLAFDESTVSSDNYRAFGSANSIGTQFSLVTKAYVISNRDLTITADRVLFGVGTNTTLAEDFTNSANSAVIGITNVNDIYALVQDGSGNQIRVTYSGFFTNFTERAFVAALTKDSFGLVTLYLNGIPAVSSSAMTFGSGPVGSINNTKVIMGNGRTSGKNIGCTIYDGHIYKTGITPANIKNMFYRGVDTTDTTLVASYNGNTLNGGPTQWLDCIESNHILIPIGGAKATNPGKRFILSFPISGTNQYLGDGSVRSVLPPKYVLTSCIVESNGKPLISVGTNSAVAPVSASGTGSWRDNRVSFVSASYGVNPIGLLALGVAHNDRTIYVAFSASAAPCTFSFDGYIRN